MMLHKTTTVTLLCLLLATTAAAADCNRQYMEECFAQYGIDSAECLGCLEDHEDETDPTDCSQWPSDICEIIYEDCECFPCEQLLATYHFCEDDYCGEDASCDAYLASGPIVMPSNVPALKCEDALKCLADC